MSEKLRTREKYSLTIREASEYFCIGMKRMRRLAEAHLGTLSVYNGNRYLIIRAEFEEYLRSNPIIKDLEEEKMRRRTGKASFFAAEKPLTPRISHQPSARRYP